MKTPEEFVKDKLNEKTGQGITLYEHYLAHDTTISVGTCVSWMKEYADQSQSEVMPSDEEIEKEEICSCNLYCTANNGFIAPLCRNNVDCVFKESHLKPVEKEEKKLIVIDETILQKAIDTWGMEAQIEMVKEECLELAIALQKLNRTRGDLEEKEKNIVDEIADVTIMIKQAHRIFSIDKINERIEYKMKRLEKRLIENL